MKKLLTVAPALALLLALSPAGLLQAKQTTNAPPPVAPPVVREGDFAIKLVNALGIATPDNETEAENMLASAGIAPKNGWISDYPVTPDILGELEDGVATAADSHRLPMGKDEALEVLGSLSAELGLHVLSHRPRDYGETPPATSPRYPEPTVINNYYYREGPPIVTYYPPPPDYFYLYAWVPYPFQCNSFFFSGFFILRDFHKVIGIPNRIVVVSNHLFHRGHRRFYRVDPVKRRGVRWLRAVEERTHGRPHFTAEAHSGARSILQRSHDRRRASPELADRDPLPSKSLVGSSGIARRETARQTRVLGGHVRARIKTSVQRTIHKVHGNPPRPFTTLGRNKGSPFRSLAAPRGDTPKGARQIRAFNSHTGARAKHSPAKKIQNVARDPAGLFRTPGISQERSTSLPSKRGINFSGGRQGGVRGFPGKFSRKLPGGGPTLKGGLRVPF